MKELISALPYIIVVGMATSLLVYGGSKVGPLDWIALGISLRCVWDDAWAYYDNRSEP